MTDNLTNFSLIPGPSTQFETTERLVSRTLADVRSTRLASEGDAWIAAGRARAAEDFEGRLSCFEMAARTDPTSAEAWRLIAQTLREDGQHDKALHAIDRSLELAANSVRSEAYCCWVERAEILIALKRYDECFACCDAAIALCSDEPSVFETKGLALYDLSRFDEAIECFDLFVERTPHAVHKAWGWSYRASALLFSGRSSEALEWCERAITHYPEASSFWTTKADCLLNLYRFEEALLTYEHASSLSPSNWIAWLKRGLLSELLGCREQAVESYERYLEVAQADDPAIAMVQEQLEEFRRGESAPLALRLIPGRERQ